MEHHLYSWYTEEGTWLDICITQFVPHTTYYFFLLFCCRPPKAEMHMINKRSPVLYIHILSFASFHLYIHIIILCILLHLSYLLGAKVCKKWRRLKKMSKGIKSHSRLHLKSGLLFCEIREANFTKKKTRCTFSSASSIFTKVQQSKQAGKKDLYKA